MWRYFLGLTSNPNMNLSQHEIAAFRRMTPADKIRLTASLYNQAKQWKRAALHAQHPEWTHDQIEACVRELFLRGTG